MYIFNQCTKSVIPFAINARKQIIRFKHFGLPKDQTVVDWKNKNDEILILCLLVIRGLTSSEHRKIEQLSGCLT